MFKILICFLCVLVSSSVQKYRKLLLSPRHWHLILKDLRQMFFVCDRQGAIRRAILYVDRSYFIYVLYMDTRYQAFQCTLSPIVLKFTSFCYYVLYKRISAFSILF